MCPATSLVSPAVWFVGMVTLYVSSGGLNGAVRRMVPKVLLHKGRPVISVQRDS